MKIKYHKPSEQTKPLYTSNEEALAAFEARAKEFEVKYGKPFYDLWLEVEGSPHIWTEDECEIFRLMRQINMVKHLMGKNGT